MSITDPKPVTPRPETVALPPLRDGERLDQPTFHQRYLAMPEHVRAELIGGVVHMASPVHRAHMRHGALIKAWLVLYEAATPGTEALDEGTVILDRAAELPPDPDGILCSRRFPGLWLDPQALVRRDLARMQEVLKAGLGSPEHATFVTGLAQAGPRE